MRTWRLLGMYNAESTTYTALAGTVTSPYTPDFNGRLLGLRTIVSAAAATTLTEHIQFRLNSTTFTPNVIEVGAQGNGLATAPAYKSPPIEWPIDQPVRSGVPITLEARNLTADTPVGVEAFIYGLFVVGG